MLIIAVVIAALTGCQQRTASSTPAAGNDKTADSAAKKTDIPGLEDQDAAADVIIRGTFDRQDKETYRVDDKVQVGHVRGACRFADCKTSRHGPPKFPDSPIDPSAAGAIADPKPGEIAYYAGLRLAESRHIGALGDSFGPTDVVALVRGVKVGRRQPLARPVLIVKGGLIRTGGDFNYSHGNVQFAPLHERVQFFTWDSFPCVIVVTHAASGKVFFEADLAKPNDQVQNFTLTEQAMVQSPIFRETGLYVVTCKRHRWQKGCVFVVDNPYVAVSLHAGHGASPIFLIENVPAGSYELEVWNPAHKPVAATVPVEVAHDQTTETLIDFECPEDLK